MITNNTILMKYRYRQEQREKYVTLSDVAEWTRNGKYAKRVDAVRGKCEVPTEAGMSSGPIAALDLPDILPAKGKNGYTGMVLLSFRMNDGVETVNRLRQVVNLWPQTLLSFLGTSGRSLKVLMPYCLPDGTLPTESAQVALFQQYAYKRAAEYAMMSTGVRPEEVAHDGTEHFRISADSEVYLNLDAQPIMMVQPTKPLTDSTAPVVSTPAEETLDNEILPGLSRRDMDTLKFNAIARELAFSREEPFGVYLMKLATECRQAGIDQELATLLTISMGNWYDQELVVRDTFRTAYQKHKMGMKNPIEKSVRHQLLLEDFLFRRYQFRRNTVTGETEVQPKFRYELSWRPLTEEMQNDMNNAAIREGIKVWPQDLERILNSERITAYDPVREWLDRLPQWDGRDRLGELADRVKTATPGWRDNFKIWMRSMVSQWRSGTDAMYGAQMVLMMVGRQGTRKSTFMRMLLPRELMTFYIDRIDFTNKKEALRALSRFLLINIDEYDQISKSQTAYLKHLIQRTDVKERKLYSTTFQQQQRYAVFCATTNSLVPLKDESGSRRYLVVEVNDPIDTDTQGDRQIDYQQLYAQIVQEIVTGKDYAFTGERERQIMENNSDYYEVPNVVSLFEDLFRKPQPGDETLLLSPTEILNLIKKERGVNVATQANATLIGNHLTRQGYTRGVGRLRRKYYVTLQA